MVIPKIKMRLSEKFILFISILIVLTSIVLSVFFIRHETIQITIGLENRGNYLVKHLTYISEYGVLIENEKMLQKPLECLITEDDVVYAIIHNKDGNILAQAEAVQPIEIPEETRKTIAKEALKAEETLVQSYKVKKESFYDIASPIVTRLLEKGREEIELFPDEVAEKGIERKIGVARIGISLARMNEQIGRVKKIAILLTLAVVSVAILGTIFFVKRLVNPIKQLVLGTERIASGDLDQKVEIESRDEIGDLANSFNRMAANLKKHSEELQQSYAILDEKNKTLAEERNLLRTLIDNLPDPIYVKDTESRFVLGNNALMRVVSVRTPEELIGKTDFDFFPQEVSAHYYAYEQEIMQSGQPVVNKEESDIDSAGNRGWVLTTKVPLRDNHGNIIGLVGINRDITERKRWHEIERMRYWVRSMQEPEEWTGIPNMLDEVLTNCGVEFIACGVNIVNLQERTMRMYTFEEHQLKTTDFQGSTVPVIETVVRENRTIYRPDTLVPGEFEEGFIPQQSMERRSVVDVPFAGGTVAMCSPRPDAFSERDIETLEMVANVISEGYMRYIDLTERKRAEEELRESKRRLEEAFANLDEKNKELESFVYTVSHDLKAPLVSLEGFASILLDNYKESLDETGQLYLSRIQANVEKMGDLIQDLLELSRIGRIVHSYESVDVVEIIKEAVETLEIQLSERGTELVVQDNLPTITCDRVRIKQVFENLIDNANKFMGEENDKPRIEIGFDTQATQPKGFHDKGESFEFFVKDNGIGIQKEYQEKVFEIFTRLGDVEVEGTGVGLAIVKKIIENHGGKIWIDSEKGKGTTVYFTLPKSAQSNPKEA